jgi:hypothetical protein
MPAAWGTRVRRLAPALLFSLLVVAVYADPLLTRRAFAGRDLLPYGLPLERAVHDAWSRGRLPTWSADVSGGRPLLPNPNAGALYPVRPLLSLLPFESAMRVFPVLHWALAGCGMLALVAAAGGSRGAAWTAAATYAFSGVIVSEVFYLPLQAGAALQPWALWALVRGGERGRASVRIGLVYGLMLLGGDAVSVVCAFAAGVLWIALELPRAARGPASSSLAGGAALGALLAAPQILATALLAPETQRAVAGMKISETLTYSLSPWRLAELAVPYPFGGTWALDPSMNWGAGVFRCFFATLYCGAFACVALALAISARGARGGPGGRFGLALFGGACVLAAAGAFVPKSWGGLASPVPLRYPEKLAVPMTLALAVLAGAAFDRIRARPGRVARAALATACLLAALAAGAAALPGSVRAAASALGASAAAASDAARQVPPALAEAGLGWVATGVALALLARDVPRRSAAAAALLTAVPLLATRRIARADRADAVYPPTPFARAIARRDPESVWRAVDASRYRSPSALERDASGADPEGTALYRESWYFHTPALWRRGTVFNSDLDEGDLSRVESLRRLSAYAAAVDAGAPFFESVSLRFASRWRDQPPLPGFRRFGGAGPRDWDENAAAERDVRLLTFWREARDAVTALGAMPELSRGEVVLESGGYGRGAARPGKLTFLERSPERLVLSVSAPDRGWLFVLRGFWAHRRVRLDGAPADTVPAQLAFTALKVPAGEHRVEWVEEVPAYPASLLGPTAFALAALALTRRRAPAPGVRRAA